MVPQSLRILVVLPALNEEEVIEKVIGEVFAQCPTATCLVVDDGSTDRTRQRALKAGALVASLPYNLGVGGAMRVGFKFARDHEYECLVQVDADGQHDPADIPRLVKKLDENDLVLGARFAGFGDYDVKGPRRWAMIVLATLISRVTRVKLTDTTSGFRASGSRAIQLFASHYPAEYLGDTVESLVIAARSGLRVAQVPVAMRARAGGTPSHGPMKSTIFLARVVVAVGFALLRPADVSSGWSRR